MAEELKYKASLDDQFTPNAKKMAAGAADLGKAAMAAGKAFLAFEAVKIATVFLTAAYKEAKEAEIATAKLTSALGKQSKALAEQASALQYKSRFEDDEITSMQAKLAGYVKSEEAIRQLTPAILDLAEATGVDLQSAALQVGRAIADDSDEMGRYKIAVEGAAGSNERAASLIQGLTDKFGGQADAAAKSIGPLHELGVEWKSLLQIIGAESEVIVDFWARVGAEQLRGLNEALQGGNETKQQIVELTAAMEDFRRQSRWEEADKIKAQIIALGNAAKDASKKAGPKDLGLGGGGLTDAQKKAAQEKAAADQKAAEEHAILMSDIRIAREQSEREELDSQVEKNKAAIAEEKAYQDSVKAMADQVLIDNDARRQKDVANEKAATDAKHALNKQVAAGAMESGQMVMQSMIDVAQATKANGETIKKMRVAQAVIDGASAIVSIWSSAGSLGPIAGPIVAGIESAAIVGITAANIATIEQQKFAQGGIVSGPKRGDSVQIRANGGERVLTEADQAVLSSALSGGGRSGGGTVINAGITINGAQGASQQTLRAALAEQEKMLQRVLRSMGNNGKLARLGIA